MNPSKSNDQFVFGFFLGLCIVVAGIFVCAASTTDLQDTVQDDETIDPETSVTILRLKKRLDKAVANEEFELAATLRDRIAAKTPH